MKSALALVAFSKGSELQGVIALLETAIEALDRAGRILPAIYVDQALNLLRADAAGDFEGVPQS